MNKIIVIFAMLWISVACQPTTPPPSSLPKVIAIETFLGDIAQNVAGKRLKVETLIPLGMDPHEFEPTPVDLTKVTNSDVVIINGLDMEDFLIKTLQDVKGLVITSSHGLTVRVPQADELVEAEAHENEHKHTHAAGDPHFWLDPINVVKYVENIERGLSQADPAGAEQYAKNAAAYIAQLKALDEWIKQEVSQIRPERRLLVTNHESLGYFADRYGFKVVGTIIPSSDTTSVSPSQEQMTHLIEHLRQVQAPAIFIETGASSALANETGVKVVTKLYSHSITTSDGEAPTYLDMMKYNVRVIVEALK